MRRRTAIMFLAMAAIERTALAGVSKASLELVVKGLDHPWGMATLADGSLLVTERSGRLRRFSQDGLASIALTGMPEIHVSGQGGLLDCALAPDFDVSREIFLSFSEVRSGGNCTSVVRAVLDDTATALQNVKMIFRQNTLHRGDAHYGSRLVFDRSGMLFVTTGDRQALRRLAQDPASHVGKVLRIDRNGKAAPGNPNKPGWAPEVWSIGHRNIQGAALHPETGKLWTAEHGARGGDEINMPVAGGNYGWPVISYGREYSGTRIGEGTARPGMEQPLHYTKGHGD